MLIFDKLTVQQKKDIRDGKPVMLTTKDGKRVNVTPELIAYARAQIQAGAGEIRLLPEVLGENRMEETVITL